MVERRCVGLGLGGGDPVDGSLDALGEVGIIEVDDVDPELLRDLVALAGLERRVDEQGEELADDVLEREALLGVVGLVTDEGLRVVDEVLDGLEVGVAELRVGVTLLDADTGGAELIVHRVGLLEEGGCGGGQLDLLGVLRGVGAVAGAVATTTGSILTCHGFGPFGSYCAEAFSTQSAFSSGPGGSRTEISKR